MTENQRAQAVASRIKEALRNADLTYVEASKKTGIPTTTLFRYASGKNTKISIDALKAIAEATRVTTGWLLGWTDDPLGDAWSQAPGEERLVDIYRMLPNEGRQYLLTQADIAAQIYNKE